LKLILAVLIGILIGAAYFYSLFLFVQKLTINTKLGHTILGVYFLGIIGVVGSIMLLWMVFHMNPLLILIGLLIGKLIVFWGVKIKND